MPSASEAKKALRDAAADLMNDLDSKAPSVPSEIVYAFQDANVQEAVARRITSGSSIENTQAMLPDILTGYRRVLISFSSPMHGRLGQDGVLIQISDSNRVVEIIDPFNFSTDKQNLLAESEGTFLTGYSAPLLRSGKGDDELTRRFEKFVQEEGISVAFSRLRQSFGSTLGGGGGVFFDFNSGTCVITTKRIPTIGKPGAPDPFPGTEGTDAEEQEDDSALY